MFTEEKKKEKQQFVSTNDFRPNNRSQVEFVFLILPAKCVRKPFTNPYV